MVGEFTSKVVLVTGAGRGIGKEIALAFAREGARVAVVSQSSRGSETAAELSKSSESKAFIGDVANEQFVSETAEEIVRAWGRIDVLVNAAAVLGPTGPVQETPPAEWLRTLEVNLFGTYLTMRAAIPSMLAAGRGKIINFAGGGAAYSYPKFSSYASSKAAVVRLTETVADELAADNIQVNVVAPGAVETDMLRQVRRAGGEVRTLVTVDLPVKLVLFLASTSSDGITGRFIHSKDDYREMAGRLKEDTLRLRRVALQ